MALRGCALYINSARDEGRSLAIGVQAQVANHRKGLWSKAMVLSVTEKALLKMSGVNQGRRTQVNCRKRVESIR